MPRKELDRLPLFDDISAYSSIFFISLKYKGESH